MSEDRGLILAALEESVSLLTEENSRYRRSNALLRRINSDLRQKLNIQHQNDENFKAMCQGDFIPYQLIVDGPGIYKVEIETNVTATEGGLLEEAV